MIEQTLAVLVWVVVLARAVSLLYARQGHRSHVALDV